MPRTHRSGSGLLRTGVTAVLASSCGASSKPVSLPLVRRSVPQVHTLRQRPLTKSPGVESRPSAANCTWVRVEQPLSHFARGAVANGVFRQRLCVYDGYWPGGDAPIFFYVGNESPVDEYVNGTGLMWQSAREFHALLIWAEHRYFGESLPDLERLPNCLAWLSSQEALADYATIIERIRTDTSWRWPAPTSPIIAFGGSYGGMLAAWFRMKYPGQVDGAIAASAPIWGFPLDAPELDGSAVRITNAASEVGGAPPACAPNLKAAWVLMADVAKYDFGREALRDAMGLCDPLGNEEDVITLLAFLQGPLFNLAEGSYPFATDYITFATFNGTTTPLPPWPMQKLCEPLQRDFGISLDGDVSEVIFSVQTGAVNISVDWDNSTGNGYSSKDLKTSSALELFSAVAQGLMVWFNVSGDQHCLDWRTKPPSAWSHVGHSMQAPEAQKTGHLQSQVVSTSPNCSGTKLTVDLAWGALVCNEGINLVNTVARGLGRDLYWPPSVPRGATIADVVNGSMAYCSEYAQRGLYGLPLQPDPWAHWMDISYGGKAIGSHSRIFFSNGDLDPWAAAGVPAPGPTANLPAASISRGGHHLDLFFPVDEDPDSVRTVREAERAHIADWIRNRTTLGNVGLEMLV